MAFTPENRLLCGLVGGQIQTDRAVKPTSPFGTEALIKRSLKIFRPLFQYFSRVLRNVKRHEAHSRGGARMRQQLLQSEMISVHTSYF